MLKSILFGPSSLNSRKQPSPVTQGKVWGLTFVTPGAIAFMAVLVSQIVLLLFPLFNITLNLQAIFLHSPDKEFASVGAKSNIPYENWFGQFKYYLMSNANKDQIKQLFMWWNGWVFSFDKAPKLTSIDDEESSGMDEAVGCLDDVDVEVPTTDQQHGWQDDDLLLVGERFDRLAVSMAVTVHQELNLPSSSSSRVTQPAESSLAFTPGPSDTHSVDQQNIMISDSHGLQAREDSEEIGQRGKGKGKEKAVDITELKADIVVAGGKRARRGRPKKTAN